MMETEPRAADELLSEHLLDKRFEVRKTKQCDGALPAIPDKAFVLRIDLRVTGTEEPGCLRARQPAVQRHHSNCFKHPGPDEFLRIRIENDLVERLRIAIENGSHHPMGCVGDGAAEYFVNAVRGTPQQ